MLLYYLLVSMNVAFVPVLYNEVHRGLCGSELAVCFVWLLCFFALMFLLRCLLDSDSGTGIKSPPPPITHSLLLLSFTGSCHYFTSKLLRLYLFVVMVAMISI